jgi:hypothetical protein
MSNSSWWANKLGQPQQPSRGITLPAQPAPAPQQSVVEAAPQPAPPQHTKPVLDPNRDANAEVPMGEAMRLWKGGEAHRMEGSMACPACGSATGYTAYSGMGSAGSRVNGQQPRPHCFECGYNGSYAQGLESNWS